MSLALAPRRTVLLSGIRPIVRDRFDRPDSASAIGVAETGHTWTALSGTWGISAGRAYCASTGGANKDAAVVDAGVADCTIEAIWSVYADGTRMIARASDLANAIVVQGSGGVQLYRLQGGSYNSIGSNAYVPVTGDRVKIMLAGSSISVFFNGALLVTATSTFNQTVTQHGLAKSDAASAARFDDFRVLR